MKLKNCAIPILIFSVSNIMFFFAFISFLNPQILLAQDSSRIVFHNPGAYTINHPTGDSESDSSNQGAQITVHMNTGEEVEGVLLSIRQNALVVAPLDDIEDKDSSELKKFIHFLSTKDIQQVIIQGHSNILRGMGWGLLGGILMGGAMGYAAGDDKSGFLTMTAGQKAMIGGIVFGIIGAVLGTAVGAVFSTGDKIIYPHPGQDFSLLKDYARYKNSEPPWLQSMQ